MVAVPFVSGHNPPKTLQNSELNFVLEHSSTSENVFSRLECLYSTFSKCRITALNEVLDTFYLHADLTGSFFRAKQRSQRAIH